MVSKCTRQEGAIFVILWQLWSCQCNLSAKQPVYIPFMLHSSQIKFKWQNLWATGWYDRREEDPNVSDKKEVCWSFRGNTLVVGMSIAGHVICTAQWWCHFLGSSLNDKSFGRSSIRLYWSGSCFQSNDIQDAAVYQFPSPPWSTMLLQDSWQSSGTHGHQKSVWHFKTCNF